MKPISRPNLPNGRHVLIVASGEYVVRVDPLITSPDRSDAKPFKSGYLASTVWEWWYECTSEQDTSEESIVLPDHIKDAPPKTKTTKRKPRKTIDENEIPC